MLEVALPRLRENWLAALPKALLDTLGTRITCKIQVEKSYHITKGPEKSHGGRFLCLTKNVCDAIGNIPYN